MLLCRTVTILKSCPRRAGCSAAFCYGTSQHRRAPHLPMFFHSWEICRASLSWGVSSLPLSFASLSEAAKSSQPWPASAPISASSLKSSDSDWASLWQTKCTCNKGWVGAWWCVALKSHLTKRKQLAEGGAHGCHLPTAMTDSQGSASLSHPALEIRRGLSQHLEKLALSRSH